ncbi:MAG: ABC transporter ATP-binding protein [Chloroflexia bacterium]|nr:ABC transporter ATP-binding protein [Chloroflexia bacterium]
MTHIALEQLHKTYPRQGAPALEHLSLEVEAHTLLALLGPSGSGKSTILKLIAGIEDPDHGDICFDGRSILSIPAHRRGAVLMFQKAYLFPFLSVADNIAFGLRAKGVRKATIQTEVQRMLDLVGLPAMAHRRPAQLSGGEQQRIALARALVVQPQVLMLDEPFSSLDPAVRQNLQEAVRRIQRELGITTILVTHDRSEALAMADQVALIERGKLVAHAPPQRLYERPPHRQAARQMGIDTFLTGRVTGTTLQSQFGPLTVKEVPCHGGEALYAIRPEHLRLGHEPGAHSLAATVQSQIYRGDHVEVQVSLGETIVRIRTNAACWSNGTCVFLHIPPEHLFLLEEDRPEPSRLV